MNTNMILGWVLFHVFVLAMLFLDMKVFHRRPREITIKESLIWSAVWIALALVFNVGIYFFYARAGRGGAGPATQFLTGYLIERSLSMDNIFVFLLIFSYFRVPPEYQHKILFWGILGALVLRALFIVAGVALIARFHFMIYVFGAFLIYTGVKMAFQKEPEIHPDQSLALRIIYRLFPVTPGFEDGKFFVRRAGRSFASMMFVTLIFVEVTDVVFALDSIPAILAISQDTFIIYTSNVFAILGLRALYFALAGMMKLFHHLHYGLSAILAFVGVKMLVGKFYEIPIGIALGAVAALLALSIVASIVWPAQEDANAPTDLE